MRKKLIIKIIKTFDKYFVSINKKDLDLLKFYVKIVKKDFLNKNDYFVIFRNFEKNSNILKSKVKLFSQLFGKTLSQNKSGKRLMEVTPKVNLLKKFSSEKNRQKLRYHQTNFGGSIHSDGPQLESPPNYIIMVCSKEADKGGDSIIVHAKNIYDFLEQKKPKHLNVLKKKFYFERRGFNYSNLNTFRKPIFQKSGNFFRFRYLKEYIEKGYKLKKKTLKPFQVKSLNLLDTLLNKKRFQKKYKLGAGDLIILNNNVLAHGRSRFNLNKGKQRSLTRIWLR